MLLTALILSVFSLNSQASSAFTQLDLNQYSDQYEDQPEFQIPNTASEESDRFNTSSADESKNPAFSADVLKKLNTTGAWHLKFILLKPDGTSTNLAELNSSASVKPASTLKLFTGWMGFLTAAKSDLFLKTMLKRSDNAMANDTLVKLGGLKKIKNYYANQLQSNSEDVFSPVDGCGLSHANRTTVGIEIELLTIIRNHPLYDRFKKLLAMPGEAEGTLKKRLTQIEQPIYAKTGTLRDTIALAGFIEVNSGTILFSVISNNLKSDVIKSSNVDVSLPKARKLIDTLVKQVLDFAENTQAQATPQNLVIQKPPMDYSPPEKF